LVEVYRAEMMYDKATNENKKLLALAKKENNQTEITKAYVNKGVILCNQYKYEEANLYLDSAQISASNTKDKLASAYAAYLSCYFFNIVGDNKKSITYGLNTLSLLEESNKDYALSFKIHYRLYSIYTRWNDLENSEKYAKKALNEALTSGNKNDLCNAYTAMAVVYTYIYQKTKEDRDFQSILTYSKKAADLYKQFPNQVSGYSYSIARNNTASYLLSYSKKITPDIRRQIEENIQESLAISTKLPYAQATQTASLGMLSNLAKNDNDWDKAEQYMLQAYMVLLTQDPIYSHVMTRVVKELSMIYEYKGDLKKALEFQKKHDEYNAKLFDQSESATVKKIEAQYQSEKKEQEIQVLKERAYNQQKQKLLSIGIGIVALLGAFYMFRSYHFRLRYSLAKEKKLAAEKQEAELQITLEKEEQYRLKAEQQLLTLQQQQLQNQVMANQLQIQHKNNVLQQLKEKLDDDKGIDLKHIIRTENLLDTDFENTVFQIKELHPNFFNNINKHAKIKLTTLDLKYCAYFYLGMETKQIANILNVEPKSVRMTKYRLKQKLNLDAQVDLITYLKSIA